MCQILSTVHQNEFGREAPPKSEYESILRLNGLKKQNSSQLQNLELSKFLRKWYIDPPSILPYDLQEDWVNRYFLDYKLTFPSWNFLDSILMELFKGKPPGFFVEAGALDGEHLSNTLQLERKLNWTGLLVEGNKNAYTRLKQKHRKCWSSPLCLATKPFPHEVNFISDSPTNEVDWAFKGSHAKIQQNESKSASYEATYEVYSTVLCVPAGHLLSALNVTHVDFFSLDVEGVEIDVLKNFPFDQITVDVWAIEHIRPDFTKSDNYTSESNYANRNNTYIYEDPDLVSYMESKGYYFFDMFCYVLSDYVFVRIKSKVLEQLDVPEKRRIRRGLCLSKIQFDPSIHPNVPKYLRDRTHWPSLKYGSNKN